ncbi:apoptosis inhibitor 5-like protein api5 [Quercus suber]|uniref:Apoptosis inhibitor 5-like protein api5 n=1 Tax=Quercus suber TaxID=58331 RepID=A0AAW0K179_QUESU
MELNFLVHVASLTGLFKHIGCVDEPSSDETIREKVLSFIRDKVFPIKAELLKPQDEMERHITDLIKKSLEDVTGAEFRMFMDFLKSLSIFGEKAPPERMKELIGIIEGQADLDAQFNVADADHIDRLISCVYMALPFVVRGASSSKFLNYLNKHIIPVFDKLPEERKLDLLKALAEISPYTTPQDSRQILPNVVQLLKKYMPRKKTGEEMNFTYVECLLYTFHHLAHKVPNATNSLCGYKIVTGQPSDRLGEDFSELNKDFTERLSNVEELTRATMKKLTQGMAEHNKAMAAAKSDEAKDSIKTQKQNTTTGLRTCNNILAMTKPLHSKTPSFIGDKKGNDLLLLLMDLAMWHPKRAVELVVCQTSWLIEHWKVCLMVGEVGLGAEAGVGVGVEEEEASGSLGVCRQSKKTFSIQKVNMYQKYTPRSP